jgi:hypothetical protein
MTSHVLSTRAVAHLPRPAASHRSRAAVVAAALGLVLVGLGAALPWLTLFNGLQPLRGFRLDGGDLSGLAVASAALLLIAARHGGSRVLRPLAVLGAAVVVIGALTSASRIAAYVADPGPTAALASPTQGVGPLVMAAGGGALVVAALIAPLPARAMRRATVVRVGLAAATFVAAWMHLVLTPEHLGESTLLGLGFLAAGLVQLALAAVVVERPSERALSLLVVVNVALLAIWAYAVLVGLPLADGGHDSGEAAGLVIGHGEPIDLAAAITKAAELASLLLAVLLLHRPGARESGSVRRSQ